MELPSFLRREDINLLVPGAPPEEIHSVPRTEDMPPAGAGMAAALGGALGLGVGVLFFVPAVGAITAFGAMAATLFGLGGAVAGGLVGKAADEALPSGVPADELYVYEDALRKGRIVVIARVKDDEEKARAGAIFDSCGAESVDAARENWWVGLRSSEELTYNEAGGSFEKEEPTFRRGFQAALEPQARGKTYQEAYQHLKARHPDEFECLSPFGEATSEAWPTALSGRPAGARGASAGAASKDRDVPAAQRAHLETILGCGLHERELEVGKTYGSGDSQTGPSEKSSGSLFSGRLLLISDIDLPDSTGHELLKKLRARDVPIQAIAVSGFGQKTDIDNSLRAGFLEHLIKPVDLPSLIQAIGKACSREGLMTARRPEQSRLRALDGFRRTDWRAVRATGANHEPPGRLLAA